MGFGPYGQSLTLLFTLKPGIHMGPVWPDQTYKLGQNTNRESLAEKKNPKNTLCKTSWKFCFQWWKRGSLIWVWQAVGSEKSYICWTVNTSLWKDVLGFWLTWHLHVELQEKRRSSQPFPWEQGYLGHCCVWGRGTKVPCCGDRMSLCNLSLNLVMSEYSQNWLSKCYFYWGQLD